MKTLMRSSWCLLVALALVPSAVRASCTATVYCSVAAIYCSGTSTCSSGPDWVQCDNQARIYCPICAESVECCTGGSRWCSGYVSCSSDSDSVTCDGHTHYCPDCPNYGSLGLDGFLKNLGTAADSASAARAER